jgi:cytochrome c
MRSHRLLAIALLSAAAGALPVTARAETTPADPVAAGAAVFKEHCSRCHDDNATRQSYGPSLVGVIGRKAATQEGFAYSDALKASGLVWTEEAVRAWMANNTGLLPGTRMRHVGITDAHEQDNLLTYLKTLKK